MNDVGLFARYHAALAALQEQARIAGLLLFARKREGKQLRVQLREAQREMLRYERECTDICLLVKRCSWLVLTTHASWPCVLLSLAGCGMWFQKDTTCEPGKTTCRGDRLQTCVADSEASFEAGEPVFHWATTEVCTDDPQLGRYTCGVVAAHATCVPERAEDDGNSDGGLELRGSSWARVRVTQAQDQATVRIDEVQAFDVPPSAAPKDPAQGTVAAVSYRGSMIVDATLVPLEPEQESAYAWVASDGADHVELVAPNGQVLSTVPFVNETPDAAGDDFGGDLGADAGLEGGAYAPSKLHGAGGAGSAGRRAVRVTARVGKASVVPTATMLELSSQALARVPEELLLLIPSAVLMLDRDSASALAAKAPADAGALPDASEPSGEGTAPDLPPDFFTRRSKPTRAQWRASKQELVIDFGAGALREYETSTLALSGDIVRAVADKYVEYTTALAPPSDPFGITRNKLPLDFPPQLAPYLRDHYAQLLASGESLVSAWHGLHQIAVDAALAQPYGEDFGLIPKSNEVAVAGGLASVDGAASAGDDVVDYLTRAAVPESWTFGPCAAMHGVPLDALAPSQLVHAAKLIALYGVGLLEEQALESCVGELQIGPSEQPKRGAIVLHKPDGERIAFTEELEGIRQPYFSDEVQLSWSAQRSYMTASLGVGYRGTRPAVMRLQAVGGHQGRDFRTGEDHGAVLAFTNPEGYQTSVVVGGLLVVTDARKDGMNAYALMAALNAPFAGTKVFPLVSAQVAKPTWGDAP